MEVSISWSVGPRLTTFKGGGNLRDSDLKKVVLNQLFSQHGDAQLDTQLHQTASIRTLAKKHDTWQQNAELLHTSFSKRIPTIVLALLLINLDI